MNEDPRIQPLHEWNRLARENTENAMVSSMLEAASRASEPMEQFSTWLLVGTAGIASFFIANAEKILPLLKQNGFLICGGCLCISCIFGLLAKMLALRCKVMIETSEAVRKTFADHLANYREEEKKITEGATHWGITIQTGIRIERVLTEFLSLLPKWAAWLAQRHLKKNAGNPQIGHIPLIKTLNTQGISTLLQALFFLGFLIAGFIFSATI